MPCWFMQIVPPSFGLWGWNPCSALDKQERIGHHLWLYLESSRTASSGLSKSKCRFGWQGTKLTRRLNTAWREDQANERTTAATEKQTNPATDLMGDESLDVDEVGIGLDGAENMGQDGERGEVGLGFGGLQDITTRKLVSTQGNHTGAQEVQGRPNDRELETGGALKLSSVPSHISPDQTPCLPSNARSGTPRSVNMSLRPAEQLLPRWQELPQLGPLCLWPWVKKALNPRPWVPTPTSYHRPPSGAGLAHNQPSASTCECF